MSSRREYEAVIHANLQVGPPFRSTSLGIRRIRSLLLAVPRILLLASTMFLAPRVSAHDAPTSFMDLRAAETGLDLALTASTTDLAHDLPEIEPAMLLQPSIFGKKQAELAALILARLTVAADGQQLTGRIVKIEPMAEKADLRLSFHFIWQDAPRSIQVRSHLFPYDPRHRTFANLYQRDRLQRQEVFDRATPAITFELGSRQSVTAVVSQFFFEGVHHIFMGPDHILFIVGLLLLGGSLGRLLKIITAFTIAHSLTLGLATFDILSPPPRLIEPAIALTVVFVGIHSLSGQTRRDPRTLLAFCFGLIHGFGFANALHEMMLPRYALGWSLFAFNTGVEIGQACIVLAVGPLLALLRARAPVLCERVVAAGALCVVTAGGFWFFERLMA